MHRAVLAALAVVAVHNLLALLLVVLQHRVRVMRVAQAAQRMQVVVAEALVRQAKHLHLSLNLETGEMGFLLPSQEQVSPVAVVVAEEEEQTLTQHWRGQAARVAAERDHGLRY
jgi:hypothetical protein